MVGAGVHRMGCGGSKNSQPLEHKQQNHQLITSISNNQFITSGSSSHADDDSGSTSDDHHADTMLRKGTCIQLLDTLL